MYAPSRTISYVLTLKGLGRSITYEVLEGGRTILGSQALRQSLELGTTLHFPVDSDERYMSLSISNEKRFGEDRKSTRLNSSHVANSYAVFCLKKKTNEKQSTRTC